MMFEQVFRLLSTAGVRYVVVGGVAVVLQGYARLTLDLDLVVELEHDNLERAIATFERAGLRPLLPVRALDFADERIRRDWVENRNMLVFTMRDDSSRPPLVVDLFAKDPLPFDELWSRASVFMVGGSAVRVAALEDLISMKTGTQRFKDQDDIEKLSALARRRRDGQ